MARLLLRSIIIAILRISLIYSPVSAQTDIKHLPTDSLLPGQVEFYNGYIISVNDGKAGLLDKNGNQKIPFLYQDIYFFDERLLLLKKDNFWAISDYEHNILSPFQFLNVDRQNHINFRNFLLFSGIDSSLKQIDSCEQGVLSGRNKSCLLHHIQQVMKTLKRELNSHKLSQYEFRGFKRYVLQGKNGYHLIGVSSYSTNFEIDSSAWDNIFMIPEIYNYPHEIGVQKGNRFGYYKEKLSPEKYLKYDGIYFDHSLYYYEGIMFSGTHNSRSPFTVVKKGNVYYQASYSKTNWLKKLTSPPNYPCRYQGKTKWIKHMSEKEFLIRRKDLPTQS